MNRTIPVLASLLLSTAALSTAAWSAGQRTPAEAQRQYQQDRAACNSGQSYQDRATCLREAGAALQEARRGGLSDEDAAFERNRLARCGYLRGDDRHDCERRMHGEGTVTGTVEDGGIYRELRTIVPAEESSTGSSGIETRPLR